MFYKIKFNCINQIFHRCPLNRPRLCYFSVSSIQNKLVVEPQSCLHDEIVNISAFDLKPKEKVTITSSIFDTRGRNFLAYAHYVANDSGCINLQVDKSISGSFTGLFPMGLITCLQPAPNENRYLRFFKKEVDKPLMVDFKLIRGHIENNTGYKSEDVIDSATHERIYMAAGVKRIPVKDGNIRGALFIPPGDGQFPGVIDLPGSAGGLIDYRAAQLASKGFVTLALAYFSYDDLPEEYPEVFKMSYFEEGVKYLLNHSKVKGSAIGAVGLSKGGDLVCSMGTFIPEVKAVVCINGLPVNTLPELETKDKTIPGLYFDYSRGKVINPGLISTWDIIDDSEQFPETHLPHHEADAQFLFLVSQDKVWRVELEIDRIINRFKAKENDNFKIVKYKGAGHLLEPPFNPFCGASYTKFARMAVTWGGEPFYHTIAQVEAWQEMIRFLKINLD